ncbi:hypothetical protein FISHEDRAFT_63653 [Fistulina hepatica ATCC 64428]|uniref:Glycoside hydrolase family 43 protein n=1 Tax=Fistulina hepatica ATCC 64428 TaxID=1128425 RepID=A0A0D7APG3_9AGAR|nr:hypothetical protein FISHEDRAFT_63653 [Fistulina hepatica ATCC 64428]
MTAGTRAQTATLGLGGGFLAFNTTLFDFQLVRDSQTLYSLSPAGSSFDFVPTDMMVYRQYDGNYHLGDITYRARIEGTFNWMSGDSTVARQNVTALSVSGNTLAAADLTPTIGNFLTIVRRWVVDDHGIELLFDVTNPQTEAVEIGAIGAALEFNNIFTNRTSEETNYKCSLFDPYIGQDAGYVQVTPLLGILAPLLVLPAENSPLEGWRFLPENTTSFPDYQSQTFEGLYEWLFHTLAYAETEWAGVEPWNAPTSAVLQPNETHTYGLRFILADSIRSIDDALLAAERPVARAFSGYVLPADQQAKLFLSYDSPVASINIKPAGALEWVQNSDARSTDWVGYTVTPGSAWGRVRMEIAYEDGMLQTVHWYNTRAAVQVVSDLGNFLTTEQWFDDLSDPFSRAPSVISYDRQANAQVKNEARVWIAGLSNEGGVGSWLAATMKQFVQPNADEIARLEQYVDETLWGLVNQSVYFYDPSVLPNYPYPSDIYWGHSWSWDREEAYETIRAYNYVHVIAAYWAMYRVARNYPDLVSVHDWSWYLNQSASTVERMVSDDVDYVDDGLMGETVILYLLEDLKHEGFTAAASSVEEKMRSRWEVWQTEEFPFGSEMAWDSTGQEGVYLWSTYFNDTKTANDALNSILAYQPIVPHWGYAGNARRYWDFLYAGKLQRIERQIHHYGSGLNALPLLERYQAVPSDDYLLRVGYSGMLGPLTNVDEGGFASAAFHSFAQTLAWDAYSGDYGPNFSGHSMGTGMFLIEDALFGWQAFGGIATTSDGTVHVEVRDSVRRRVYIAPLGTLFALDAGAFVNASYVPDTHTVTLAIAATVGIGTITPVGNLAVDAGAYVVPFADGQGTVVFSDKV